jgi:hypothetical protein
VSSVLELSSAREGAKANVQDTGRKGCERGAKIPSKKSANKFVTRLEALSRHSRAVFARGGAPGHLYLLKGEREYARRHVDNPSKSGAAGAEIAAQHCPSIRVSDATSYASIPIEVCTFTCVCMRASIRPHTHTVSLHRQHVHTRLTMTMDPGLFMYQISLTDVACYIVRNSLEHIEHCGRAFLRHAQAEDAKSGCVCVCMSMYLACA